jgi:hypothetical protein
MFGEGFTPNHSMSARMKTKLMAKSTKPTTALKAE